MITDASIEKAYRIIKGPESIQGSSEWHEFRKGKIGASMAPAIMGVSPFQTKKQLWEELVFETKRPPTRAMQRGIELEEKARKWFNQKLGTNYAPAVVQSIAHPDLIASLDGYYEDQGGKPHICEIKCPGEATHREALAGKIPECYHPQLQMQMDLVGTDQMVYVSFDGIDGVMLTCKRDKDYCVDLLASVLSFYSSTISMKPPIDSNSEWVQCCDEECQIKAERYQELLGLIEQLKTECDEIKGSLILKAVHPKTQIGNIRLQKVTSKGQIDYAALLRDHKITNAEEYRKKAIESWRITVC